MIQMDKMMANALTELRRKFWEQDTTRSGWPTLAYMHKQGQELSLRSHFMSAGALSADGFRDDAVIDDWPMKARGP